MRSLRGWVVSRTDELLAVLRERYPDWVIDANSEAVGICKGFGQSIMHYRFPLIEPFGDFNAYVEAIDILIGHGICKACGQRLPEIR